MAELIRKVLDCEIKKLGDRSYEFTASTSAVDREGEVIDAKGWDLKNFKKNPVIMYAHDYRSLPIGKASRVWLSDGNLKNVVEFPPEGTYGFADIVERLVDTGYLKAESVGFLPKKWEDGDGKEAPRRTYTKQELLEISIVPVPANPEALRNAVEDGVITTKQMEYAESEINRNEYDVEKQEGIVNGELAKWLFPITKPEETETHIRIPVRDCKVTATIDISKKEGIKALYCGKIKKVRTYIFDKRAPYNWTMAKAKKWVEDHKSAGDLPEGIEVEEKDLAEDIANAPIYDLTISQEQLSDEMDYVKACIGELGLNDKATKVAWGLVREIMRLAGNDIPDDIRDEIGVTITAEQELKVRDAIDYLTAYLMGANVEEPDEPETEPELDEARVGEIVAKAVGEAIGQAQGKI